MSTSLCLLFPSIRSNPTASLHHLQHLSVPPSNPKLSPEFTNSGLGCLSDWSGRNIGRCASHPTRLSSALKRERRTKGHLKGAHRFLSYRCAKKPGAKRTFGLRKKLDGMEASSSGSKGMELSEEDVLDPEVDVHALFAHYNDLYFNGLIGACTVEWSSSRMTLCAGVCCFSRTSGCRIKLSAPLLQLRPKKDLKETLLHEMIHAYLFLQGPHEDREDHGPNFQAIMYSINQSRVPDSQRPLDGYRITVYHTMNQEVEHYRVHHWVCDRCGDLVKRAMNRKPQEADLSLIHI